MVVISSEPVSGNQPQVVQSYGIDSLLSVSSRIVDIREFHFRRGRGSRPQYKQIQQYPKSDEFDIGTGILNIEILTKLFGKRAAAIRKLLADKGFCRPMDDGRCGLTWRFRNLSPDDFDINLGPKSNADVYRSLDALLWQAIPETEGIDRFLKNENDATHQITPCEYWFRQGIDVVAIRFTDEPSPELISLIDHKLQVIQQDKMQNYFHIISSFNSDSSTWMNETNRTQRFFEIVENLLVYTWRPFDMKSCEVSIDAAGDEALVASGTLRVDFSESGVPVSRFDRMDKHFQAEGIENYEFVVNDVVLRAGESTGKPSYLSLHMVSRSAGNVDPRQNMLTHRFVKLFVESVGKLIDVIMPVIRREEAIRNLRWRYFLDSLRMRALEYGENLHHIVRDSLVVLRNFFGVSEVNIFSEDKDLSHMIDLFSRSDSRTKTYRLLDHPLSPAEILKRQMLVFPIREIPGGRVLLYFDLPQLGNRPLNPESPDQYLMGTEIWNVVNEEAMIMGLPDLKDYLFFMVTECLTANPKAALANLSRRLPVRGSGDNIELLTKLSRRILERLNRFFDLFQALSSNLESGLAYMRGRRDNLTGLYNRQHFTYLLNESFHRQNYEIGLMFLDMDNFKIFNDAVSHDFGDKLLISLSNRMIDSADKHGSNAVPGRFGGDEFCYFIGDINKDDFEARSIEVFRNITRRPLVVSFFFDDRSEGDGMEINIIAFLHRLMRPDVGSRQASQIEYVEKPHMGPKAHVIDVWKHYQMLLGESTIGLKIRADRIIDDITKSIEDKILYNNIFPEIDVEFSRIIQLFVTLQLKNYTTNRIREYLIGEFNTLSVERNITIKISSGLSHKTENRLRSTESLFKAADNRAYLAKHNGRNCLFGIDGQRLT